MTNPKKFFRQAAKGTNTQIASRALQRLVENSPGFGSLVLFAGHVDCEDGEALSWTDGNNIYYPKAFSKISLAEQIGVVAHEAMHIAFRHIPRAEALRRSQVDYSHRLANIAMDAIINQTLSGYSWLQIPGKPVMLVELLKESLGIEMSADDALAQWDFESLYKAISDRTPRTANRNSGQGKPQPGRNGGNGQRQKGRNSDRLGPEDGESPAERAERYAKSKGFEEDTTDNPNPYNEAHEQEEARTWRNRILRAQAGDGTHGILRRPLADLPSTATPWEHILRSKLNKTLAPRTQEDYSRPSRRWLALEEEFMGEMPYEPGINPNTPFMKLAICVDTSGSIGDDLLNRFLAEIKGVVSRTGAKTYVIVADCEVHDVFEVSPDNLVQSIRKLEFRGHGGTDFSPALKKADELKVSQVVYLTDLEGPAEYKAKAPVVWTVPKILRNNPRAPYGTLLLID
jgi:predicted metal-dependent peptidase